MKSIKNSVGSVPGIPWMDQESFNDNCAACLWTCLKGFTDFFKYICLLQCLRRTSVPSDVREQDSTGGYLLPQATHCARSEPPLSIGNLSPLNPNPNEKDSTLLSQSVNNENLLSKSGSRSRRNSSLVEVEDEQVDEILRAAREKFIRVEEFGRMNGKDDGIEREDCLSRELFYQEMLTNGKIVLPQV